MPRYFFHRADGGYDTDQGGTDLVNIQSARLQAVLYAAETMREHPDYVWEDRDLRVEVTNEAGELLFIIVMQAIDAPDTLSLASRDRGPQTSGR